MAVISETRRKKLWFGTLERMQWVETPNRGADVSPHGWNAGGTLLSGGAYQLGSFSAARNYVFEWPASSTPETAYLMSSYASGAYGRGLIYFVDPMIYESNVLPAMWANPSMGAGFEAQSIIPGVTPTLLPSSGPASWNLPVNAAFFDLTNVGTTDENSLDDANSVFIPVPEGYQLMIGSVYSSTGSARVQYSRVSRGGSVYGSYIVPNSVINPLPVTVSPNPGDVGIRLWAGKSTSGGASLSITSMMARLKPVGGSFPGGAYWVGGQGHSGCRFAAQPTLINNSGVSGGQMSFAASFREVGSWSRG